MMRIFGLGVIGCVVVLTGVRLGMALLLVDVQGMLFVGGVVLGGLMTAGGLGPLGRLPGIWLGRGAPTPAEQVSLVAYFRTGAHLAYVAGLLGTLIGVIAMLANLSDPMAVGPTMAVALLTTLYGLGLAECIFMPTCRMLAAGMAGDAPGDGRPWPWVFLTLFVVLACFAGLVAVLPGAMTAA